MKNLEFRAWYEDYGEYLDSEYWKITNSGAENYADEDAPLIVEQWTGVLDKNGIKIFEGDIVHFYKENVVDKTNYDAILLCQYDSSNAWYIFQSSIENTNEGYYWSEIKGHCEVIGNIHENPEIQLKP